MIPGCSKCLLRNDQVAKTMEIPLMTQYIPSRVVRSIGELPCCFFERKLEQLTGVVVYFDIVGFTAIVANHVNSGKKVGVLSDIFRTYYTLMIDTVKLMGGSVFQFAGDSLLICFEKLYGETEESNWNRALSAVTHALEKSDKYNLENCGTNGFPLDPKIGMGYGPFYQILLGDQTGFITPILAGSTVDEAIASERLCKGREIIVGPNAWNWFDSQGMANCFVEKNGGYLLQGLPDRFNQLLDIPDFCDEQKYVDNPRFYNRLNAFINPVIQHQIKTNYLGFAGEYREITCVMVRFEGQFNQTRDEFNLIDGYANLNTVYQLMQDKASRYVGFCTKPDLSDKGTVFPVLFGAPTALENKERNAILFVDELLKLQSKFSIITAVRIGVATGHVYCGEFGGSTQKDYSVVGSSINLASRIMMMAEANGALLDEHTQKKTETLCDTEASKKIFLKGYATEQAVFRYLGFSKDKKAEKKLTAMVGRNEELKRLRTLFDQAMAGEIRYCSVLGEAGMGKSFLIDHFLLDISEVPGDRHVLVGSCYQYEKTTVFFPWRSVVRLLLQLTELKSKEDIQEAVTQVFLRLFSQADLIWVTFFLNMLGYEFEEHEFLKEFDVAIKQERFFAFLYQIILDSARKKPLVIVLEDIHWSDSVSLGMLEYLINGASQAPLFIVPVSREAENIIDFLGKFPEPPLELNKLKPDAARKLTQLLLQMDPPEETLVKKIISASDCNPFFIENIVHNMIESGVLVEEPNGTYFLSKGIQNINIPSSIQNIILARLTALLFEEQVVCKTASVIGRTFFSDILLSLVPKGISEYTIFQALENFETHNLIFRETDRSTAYFFKHVSIRDVVYNTILESTRKELNLSLLSFLEAQYANNISAVVERLEYHSVEAEAWEKVYQYGVMAAKKSEKQFSYTNVITHYTNALDALKKLPLDNQEEKINEATLSLASAFRKNGEYKRSIELYQSLLGKEKTPLFRAAVLQGIGQCHQEEGRFHEAVDVLEDAMGLLGDQPPRSVVGTYMAILLEVVSQTVTQGVLGNKIRQWKDIKQKYAEMRADILFLLSKMYYFGRIEKLAWATIRNYNNTLRIKDSTDTLSMAISNYALTLVSGGFTKIGLALFKEAEKTAVQSRSRMANSLYKSRYAYYFLLYNQPSRSIELLEDATNHFRSIGEMWELMSALGALAQNYFLITDLEKSEKAYLETERVARKLNSPMHIGWAYNKVPFIRYLQGKMTGSDAVAMMNEGISLSSSVHDHMTLCIQYGHLAFIAEKEGDLTGAVSVAREILKQNKLYTVNFPHVKISYVNAVEAFCFALESGADFIAPPRELLQLAEEALAKALAQGKTFGLIAGPAYRAAARLALFQNKHTEAQDWCRKSLDNLKNSPYEWEYAHTMLMAARCFPNESSDFLGAADQLFAKNGIVKK